MDQKLLDQLLQDIKWIEFQLKYTEGKVEIADLKLRRGMLETQILCIGTH